MKTIEEFYIEKFGVCPMIEKEVALHSYYDMLEFAKDFYFHKTGIDLDKKPSSLFLKIYAKYLNK